MAHLRVTQPLPVRKTPVLLVDPIGPAYPEDPRKKTRRAKLHKIPNAILFILAAPKATGHQDGHSSGEWPMKDRVTLGLAGSDFVLTNVGLSQIIWAHSHLIRADRKYSQLMWARNRDDLVATNTER